MKRQDENKIVITNEERARIFMMYWRQQFVYSGSLGTTRTIAGINKGWDIIDDSTNDTYRVDKSYMLLTPLDKLDEEKIMELLRVAAPNIFKGYKYCKWSIIPHKDNGEFWRAVDVVNDRNGYSFQVDLIDGEVKMYDEGDVDPLIHHDYWQWYFKEGIAIPLHPWEKTAIELGMAIDKTIDNA